MKKIKKPNLNNKKDKLKKVGKALVKAFMSKEGLALIAILALCTLGASEGGPPPGK